MPDVERPIDPSEVRDDAIAMQGFSPELEEVKDNPKLLDVIKMQNEWRRQEQNRRQQERENELRRQAREERAAKQEVQDQREIAKVRASLGLGGDMIPNAPTPWSEKITEEKAEQAKMQIAAGKKRDKAKFDAATAAIDVAAIKKNKDIPR